MARMIGGARRRGAPNEYRSPSRHSTDRAPANDNNKPPPRPANDNVPTSPGPMPGNGPESMISPSVAKAIDMIGSHYVPFLPWVGDYVEGMLAPFTMLTFAPTLTNFVLCNQTTCFEYANHDRVQNALGTWCSNPGGVACSADWFFGTPPGSTTVSSSWPTVLTLSWSWSPKKYSGHYIFSRVQASANFDFASNFDPGGVKTAPALPGVPAEVADAPELMPFAPVNNPVPEAPPGRGRPETPWPQGRRATYNYTIGRIDVAGSSAVSPNIRNLYAPGVSVQTMVNTQARARPRSNEKERKIKANNKLTVFIKYALGAVGEVGDAIDALFDALPDDCRKGARGVTGRAQAIYDCFDNIDVEKAVTNLLLNHFQDMLIGKMASQRNEFMEELGLYSPNKPFGGSQSPIQEAVEFYNQLSQGKSLDEASQVLQEGIRSWDNLSKSSSPV